MADPSLFTIFGTIAVALGLQVNAHGGLFRNGVPYHAEKKVHVIACYEKLKQEKGGMEPSTNAVPKESDTIII